MAMAPLPEEILDRFRSSSRNRLTQVEAAWAAATQGMATDAMVREMHRNVHTLKGDARMVQFQDIDLVCQKLEDLLSVAEGLRYHVSADVDLSVSMALDFMGLLLRRRGDQEVSGIDLDGFVAQVHRALRAAAPASKQERAVATQTVLGGAEPGDAISQRTRGRLAIGATKVFLEYLSASGVARTRLRSAWRDLQQEIEHFDSMPVTPVIERHALATHALALDLDCRVELQLELQPDVRVSAEAARALDVAMMHVLRNALSHGIAESDEAEGKLSISSVVDDEKAIIIVRDNGRGIDVEEVRQRALGNGAMHPDVARDATREDLLELLFQARFSTRDIADEIAGRGIGLDAVRTEIRRAGGDVKIDGNPGQGAVVTIRLPLVRRQLDIQLFDAYGGRLVLAVPAKWSVTTLDLGASESPVDPLARLQVRRPADVTGLTQAGPPQVLRLEHAGDSVDLVAAKSSRAAVAIRICPTPGSFPAEVVTVEGVEVLLLRPDKLPPSVPESEKPSMSSDFAQKNVLILDDSEVVLGLARKYLQDAGFLVSTAISLAEFDRHKAAREPDLILLDVQMPELEGDDLGRTLRRERGVTAPILLFSTLEDDELRERAESAGLSGFVSKNASLDAMVAEVQSILGER